MAISTFPARITVTGRIDNGDTRPEIIRNEYPGTISLTLTGFRAEYTEPETDSRVTLDYNGREAVMERSGQPESRLEFAPGERRNALYLLPEGAFDLRTECLTLKFDRIGGRGTLRISYRLLSGGELMSENRLMLNYVPC